MKHSFLPTFILCISSTFFLLVGCGDDGVAVGNDGTLVGASCQSTADCDERCLSGGDFPQGTCTASCSTDDDCPGGTFCIEDEGGVCLLGCDLPSDCRGGYTCKGKSNQGHGGESLVCIAE